MRTTSWSFIVGSFLVRRTTSVRRCRLRAHRSRDRYVTEIGRLTDAPTDRRRHDRIVEITIRLDGIDPPVGRVSLAGGEEVVFVGWLGLLRALSDLLESAGG